MATTKAYATILRDTANAVGLKLGYDLRQADQPMRVALTTVCVLLGGVLRVIFSKNLATDAELNAVFTAVKNADYPVLPSTAPPVDENNPDPVPPDLGG